MRDKTNRLAAVFIFSSLLAAGCGNTDNNSTLITSDANVIPPNTIADTAQTQSGLTKTLDSVLNQLREVYLFPSAIPENLNEFETVEMLIATLDDPFSRVIDEFSDTIEVFFGAFRGIGVQIQQIDGITFFPVVFPTQPAAVAGVRANDILLGIDNEWVEEKPIPEILEMIQRDLGEPVHLRIQRDNAITTISPVFSEFQRSSIFSTAITDQIAYVGVFTFLQRSSHPSGTDGEISDFLLRDSSPVIIMDFRNNLGGTLEDAIQTADLFVESGTLIELFDLTHTDIRSAIPGDPGEGRAVVLLQNGQSASASEIVIASLRDNLGSHIIGTRSFGKAVSQSFFRFTDDPGGLQLVTGGILSPRGENYNEIGIAPDQLVEFVFNPKTFSDTQLDAAITFARSLPNIDPNQPIQRSALKKIKAFRQTLDTKDSPILLDYIEQ
tara:strand:- start:2875 stop:4191 length:1317 start_codon:yes stop_codon:yes gene_type:complete